MLQIGPCQESTEDEPAERKSRTTHNNHPVPACNRASARRLQTLEMYRAPASWRVSLSSRLLSALTPPVRLTHLHGPTSPKFHNHDTARAWFLLGYTRTLHRPRHWPMVRWKGLPLCSGPVPPASFSNLPSRDRSEKIIFVQFRCPLERET